MPTRWRSKSRPLQLRALESRVGPASATPVSWEQQVDLRELATGAFLVTMLLVGSELWPDLFTDASDILLAQVMFEFPMALLAVCAGQAARHSSWAMRVACILLGLLAVALAGSVNALNMDAAWAIVSGGWLLATRAAPPRGIPWFSPEHCRAIELTVGTAWVCLLGALLLLVLGNATVPPHREGATSHAFVYAIAWGAYYVGLSLLLPYVRLWFSRSRRR